MWFVLVPVLVYLGVGVVLYLILVAMLIREGGLVEVLALDDILDTFRYEGIYEGVKRICSGFLGGFVLTIILVLGLPALIGICCIIAVLDPKFRRGTCAAKYQ